MSQIAGVSQIQKQLMWDRLIAIVEEQAQTLIRTAFSPSVRESGDLSAGVFDRRGRMIAQAVTGTPGHVNSMAIAVKHFIDKFPMDTMKPGDVFITNDPWIASGHMHDFTVVTPAFHKGRAVATFANTVHVVDVGGRGFGPDGRQVFEEGINIPIMYLAREGEMNQDLLEIISMNVREPEQVHGDFYSMAASNDEGCRRLQSMLAEFDLDDIEGLGDHIVDTSRQTALERARALPRGSWSYELNMDGYDEPLTICSKVTVSDDGISVDYNGTSPASQYGINVVMNYCIAYTTFGVNCIVAPDVPCNHGSLSAVSVSAPEGSIVNTPRPWPVAARHVIGQMLPDAVFGCLTQAIPDRVPAEGASAMWNASLRGGPSGIDRAVAGHNAPITRPFETIVFNTGGMGARPTKDGLTATAFPSGVMTTPAEALEATVPVVVWRKEYRENSGGAGEHRGGLGQVFEVGGLGGAAFSISAMCDRIDNPAKGRLGGKDGQSGEISIGSGAKLNGKGRQTIPAFDTVRLSLPGGGGYGDPVNRDPARVREDVADGLISKELAEQDYKVVIGPDGDIDQAATERLRSSG